MYFDLCFSIIANCWVLNLWWVFWCRVELSVNGFLRTRDMEVVRYQEFNIPIEWMLDFGVVGKVRYMDKKPLHQQIE